MSEIKRPDQYRYNGTIEGIPGPIFTIIEHTKTGDAEFWEYGWFNRSFYAWQIQLMPEMFEEVIEEKEYRMTARQASRLIGEWQEHEYNNTIEDFDLIEQLEAICNPPKTPTEPEPKPDSKPKTKSELAEEFRKYAELAAQTGKAESVRQAEWWTWTEAAQMLDNLEEDRNPKPIYTESEMVSFGNFARSRWAKNNIYYCLSKWKEANQ